MSMTPVPISILEVLAPMAASSGNGLAAWRAKWWTRKYAPSNPSSSAATARSMDWRRKSLAERACEPGVSDQWPNERKPIFFTRRSVDVPDAAASAALTGLAQEIRRAAARFRAGQDPSHGREAHAGCECPVLPCGNVQG